MRYTIVRMLAIAISILIPYRAGIAQRLPTDTELRAAYCMPVVNNDIEMQRQIIQLLDETAKSEPRVQKEPALSRLFQNAKTEMQQNLVDSQSALRRLALYILPRMTNLDATSLLIANKRAEEDVDLIRRKGNACIPQCIKSTDVSQCVSVCANLGPEFKQRRHSCRDLSWLPY